MAQKELRFTLCYPEWLSDIQGSYQLGLETVKTKQNKTNKKHQQQQKKKDRAFQIHRDNGGNRS